MASRWSHANAIRIEDPQLLRQGPTFRRLDALRPKPEAIPLPAMNFCNARAPVLITC